MKTEIHASRIARFAQEQFSKVLLVSQGKSVTVDDVLRHLHKAGIRCYVAGGAVRDWLDGKYANDIDISLDENIAKVKNTLMDIIPDLDLFVLDELKAFGAFKLGTSGGIDIDFNILRSISATEGKYLYDTTFYAVDSLKDDVALRDFSFNAIYWDVPSEKLHDPTGNGIEDLFSRTIRIVTHEAILASNYKTSLRIAKFLMRGFVANEETQSYLLEHIDTDISNLGCERVANWLHCQILDKKESVDHFANSVEPLCKTSQAKEILKQARASICQGAPKCRQHVTI